MLVLEEQRYVHEDLERLEQGIADRMHDEPKHVCKPLDQDYYDPYVSAHIVYLGSTTFEPRSRSIAITRSDSKPIQEPAGHVQG